MRYAGLLMLIGVVCLGCEDDATTVDGQTRQIDMGSSVSTDNTAGQGMDGGLLADTFVVAPNTPDFGDDAVDAEVVSCTPNEVLGCADLRTQSICDETGTARIEQPCSERGRCEGDGTCVPVACVEGERVCIDDSTVGACRRDESGYTPIRSCDPESPCLEGRCESVCNPMGKVPSNVGCEYWSVDLDNYPDPFSGYPDSIPHAAVISNTTEVPAIVSIEGPSGLTLTDAEFTVAPGSLEVFTFPRLDIDGTGIFDRAFKINATQPVIVYQFNPLNNEGVASNDASLLLPKEGLGRDYIGLSWPSGSVPCFDPTGDECLPPQSGYLTIVATSSGSTLVRVTPSVIVDAGGSVPELAADVEHEFALEYGEVLNLQAKATDLEGLLSPCSTDADCGELTCQFGLCIGQTPTDLTGTLINATQPIAVFGGHEEAVIGMGTAGGASADSTCCAEHLEQQLLPISSWGTHYLAARSEPRGGSDEYWRIVAEVDGTRVQTTLNDAEQSDFMLNRGEYKQLITAESFEVTASAPVMLGQYLVSQGSTQDNIGDPALIVVPPIDQLRDKYQIIIPSGYSENWLTIARPIGSRVSLDNVDIAQASFTVFGDGQYEYAWIAVEEGVHNLEGDAPFSLIVYGHSAAVSYGYPGGLNLRSDEMP